MVNEKAPGKLSRKKAIPSSGKKRLRDRPPHRMGFVTIMGRPNVGKSTLLNALLEQKLAITSPKPQTTRQQLLGVLTHEGYQIVFWDTPGYMHRTRDALDRRMLSHVQESMLAADLALLVVEPKLPGNIEKNLLKALTNENTVTILVINKVDTIDKLSLLPLMESYIQLYPDMEIVPISAIQNDGTDLLIKLMVKHLPQREAEYEEDEVTDRSERYLAAEFVREQLFRAFGKEIPYDTAVEVEKFQEANGTDRLKDYIQMVVYVNKPSQRRILIGKGGAAMKSVSTAARLQMEEVFGRKIFLEVWVQVWTEWRNDPIFLEEVGY